MADDRRTGIQGDQIEDDTITKDELDIINEPINKMVLGWDEITQKFKWYYASDIATRLDYYQSSEAISLTTSTQWQDKVIYNSPILLAGLYEFWYYCELKRNSNPGAIQRARLTVDNIEYCIQGHNADIEEFRGAKGYIRLSFATDASHDIKIQFQSGTNGRSVAIQRARLRVISVGI